jgi:hypothetical protein
MMMDPEMGAFERELLGSWSAEQPSAAARDRAMALGTVAATAALAGAAGVSASAAAPNAISATTLAVAKWLAIGTAVTGAAVGGATYLRQSPAAEEAPAPTAVATVRSGATTLPARPVTVAPSAAAVDSATRAAATASATADGPPRVRERSVAPPGLSEQIDAIDRARAAITAGDGARATQLVDDYERRFPRGVFVQEAEVLRIEARVLRGDRAGAARAAERFLAAHPNSPHSARLRALAGTRD